MKPFSCVCVCVCVCVSHAHSLLKTAIAEQQCVNTAGSEECCLFVYCVGVEDFGPPLLLPLRVSCQLRTVDQCGHY